VRPAPPISWSKGEWCASSNIRPQVDCAVASAIRFDDRPPGDAHRPPLLGEHTVEVLSDWLGFDASATEVNAMAVAFGPSSRDYSAGGF
jgi:hypothetical protein